MANLAGLHDIEATAIAAPDSWILDTVALSENPPGRHYPPAFNHIARLNHAYGSGGTIPPPNGYNDFAARVGRYVSASTGCHRWVIGNEPSLPREWPNGEPIYPWHYANCYRLCRDTIHALAGHAHDEVLVAASGPWNNELKYQDNPTGDWIIYFADVLNVLEGEYDGYALHSYTHGYDVSLVTSTARMDAPFQDRYYNFLAYRDYCDAIPVEYAHLPAYITEANGDGPWQAVGLMPAMLGEIDFWNRSNNTPLIHCVAFYRYPRYDQFYIEGRGDVIAEYRAAVAKGYQSPEPGKPQPQPPNPEPPIKPPKPPQPPEPEADYLIEWDSRLDQRGTVLGVVEGPGDTAWHVTHGLWFDEQEAQGRINVFVTVLDEQGQLVPGVPVRFWNGGEEVKNTEIKYDPWLGRNYSLDFAMYNTAPAYGLQILGGLPTDILEGLGLGDIENPHHKIHTCYSFVFQRLPNKKPQPPRPTPEPPVKLELVHPLPGAVITQRFGENPDNYIQFGQVAHNGVDFGNKAERTPVRSIADGEVVYVGFDEGGYGFYCRIAHPQLRFYSFYAHLSVSASVEIGQSIRAGQTVGLLGNSGNSTGVHLHLEIRQMNPDGSYAEGQYGYYQGRVDPQTVFHVLGSKL